MLWDGMACLALICIILAIGDIISVKTRAIVSVLLVSAVAFRVLIWGGLVPGDVFDIAGITGISSMMLGLMLVNMGSMLNLKEFLQQWKVVVVGVAIVVGGGFLMYALAIPIIGNNLAVAMTGPITGGFVSAIVISDVATPLGLTQVNLLAAIIIATQGLVGYPLGTIFVRKEAQRLVKGYRNGTIAWTRKNPDELVNADKRRPWQLPSLPQKLQTPFVLLGKCALVAWISFRLADLTNGVINTYVMCLVVATIAREINFLEYDILKKGSAYGIALMCVMSFVIGSLDDVSPQMVLDMIWPVIVAFVVGCLSIAVVGLIVGKIFGLSWQLSIAMATTCLYGFPGSYILSDEAAKSIGATDDERQMISDNLVPPMLVSGFVCLTITSVLLTGVMVNFLSA